MRREPIEVRKATLASILRKTRHGLRFNEHLEHDCGLTVFQRGLEGIVSKRLGSRYRSGRSPDWLKFKNPEAPAVRREAEEDGGQMFPARGLAVLLRNLMAFGGLCGRGTFPDQSVPCNRGASPGHRLAHGFRTLSMSHERREGTGLV